MPVTVAELVVLAGVLSALLWLLAPLRRWIRRRLERRSLKVRYGEVIEARFKPEPEQRSEPRR